MFANQLVPLDGAVQEALTLEQLTAKFHTGKCCRVCDRKFFLRESFAKYARQISHYESQARTLEQDLQETQQEIDEVENEKMQVRRQLHEEQDRLRGADDSVAE